MDNSEITTRTSSPSGVNVNDNSQGGFVDNSAIKVTSDYTKFKFILTNRDRRRGHIENLKKAFEENGNLTKVQPILVNDQMEIIDGQHRYVAAKELSEPIYYTVAPGLGVHEARQMNILHKTWDTSDFARSYADGGDASYKRYLELIEEYEVSHSVVMYYVVGEEKKGVMAGFRNGEFSLTPEQKEITAERLEHLTAVGEFAPMWKQREFAVALLKCMNVPGYDPERMLSKLSFSHDIPKYASVLDYQRKLEDIYNFRTTDANKIRLF